MQSYNQIIKLNKDFADNHFQIKTFGNGKNSDIVLHDKQDWFSYPLMWMEDLPINVTDNEMTFSFRVYFINQVATLKDREGDKIETNLNEVKSDMIQCALDLLSFWEKDVDYYSINLVKSSSIQPIEDELSDRVTGCFVDLRLNQGFRYNKCAIPMSGVTPPTPTSCAPVSIYEDEVFVEDVASGGEYRYTTVADPVNTQFQGAPTAIVTPSGQTLDIQVVTELDAPTGAITIDTANIKKIVVPNTPCADADVTVNSSAFNSVASGGTLDVPVKYVNGTPIGTIVGGIVEIPNPIVPVTPLNTADIFKTGATALRTGDDGTLAFGRGVDFVTLDFNNGFGVDANRFTDSLGTQVYASDEVIDWSTWNQVSETVLGYYRVPNANANLTTQLAGQPYTRGSYSDWYICNYKQMNNIQNLGITRDFFNYAPLNIAYLTTSDRMWCSTSDSATVGLYFLNTGTSLASQGSSYKAVVCRTFTLAELGL